MCFQEKISPSCPTRTSPRPSSFSRNRPSPFRHEDPTVRTSHVPNSISPFCLTAVSCPSRPSPSRNSSHHSPRRAPICHQTGVSHSTPPRRQLAQPSFAQNLNHKEIETQSHPPESDLLHQCNLI